LWSTRDLPQFFKWGSDSLSAFPPDFNGLDDLDYVAREYLSGCWRSSYFEKLLCEAYISVEAWHYARDIKENVTKLSRGQSLVPSFSDLLDNQSDANLARNNAYNMDKLNKAFVKRSFRRFGERLFYFVGLPVAVGFVAYNSDKAWSEFVFGAAVTVPTVYIGYHTIAVIFRMIFSAFRVGLGIEAKEDGWNKHVKLFLRMAFTYKELSEGNAPPYRVLKLIEKDFDEGISYRGNLFSILLRASDDKNYNWGTEASEL
jgi:hypothetical protein